MYSANTVGIYRITILHNLARDDASWIDVDMAVWTIVEISMTVLCSCALTFRPLLSLIFGRRAPTGPSAGKISYLSPDDPIPRCASDHVPVHENRVTDGRKKKRGHHGHIVSAGSDEEMLYASWNQSRIDSIVSGTPPKSRAGSVKTWHEKMPKTKPDRTLWT